MVKNRCLACLALLFGMTLSHPPAWSQSAPVDLTNLSLEDLLEVTIESVSKFEQKVSEAPSSVTIVTGDDIKKYGYRNLADVLASVGGLFTRYDRNYHYLGMRGFSRPGDFNTRFLLLVDGHRMNDNIYDQAAIGNDFILDIDLIDRVEVIRGASSSLYGTNAFLGIINVKTKSGEGIKGLELSGEGGRFSTYKGRLSYGNRFDNGLEVLLSGTRYGSDGNPTLFYKEFNAPATNFGIAKNADGEMYGSLFGRMAFQDFTLAASYNKRKKEIPTAAFETVFNDDDTQTTDARGFVEVKYDHRFFDDWGFRARLYYDHFKQIGDYVTNFADPGDPPLIVKSVDDFGSDSIGGEWQVTKTLFGAHTFVLGGEYRNVFNQKLKNSDLAVNVDKQTQSQNWALFLQDEFEIIDKLRMNGGVRYDHYGTFGGTLNPRIGLIYRPLDKTIFKLLYGQAFRAPNAFELYYNDGGVTQKASPNLSPETVRSVEVSVQQFLGFNLWGNARLYSQWIKDLITQQIDPADGLLVYRNTKGAEQKGVELELEGRWQNGVRGRLSYALQKSEEVETRKLMVNSPAHLIKLNGIAPLFSDKLFLGLEEQFTSRRKTLAGLQTRDFFVTHATLFSEKIIEGLELSASIYNLFDRKYSDPAGPEHIQNAIRQDGRSFRFKLTYRF
jgi:iron complex outermembrane receptor protein